MMSSSSITVKIKQGGFYALSLCACLEVLSGCASLNFFSQGSSSDEQSSKEKLVFEIPEAALKPSPQIIFEQQYPTRAPSYALPKPRLEVNNEVRRELAIYLKNNASCISQHLERQESLFPVLSKIFQDEGIPDEMLNLALIESGFRPEASSSAGAVGIWQFMASTAKLYGLKVNKKVDERKDPILSTIAAARHLKDLYAKYKDWFLVLAAYNAGEGAISKIVLEQSKDRLLGAFPIGQDKSRDHQICAKIYSSFNFAKNISSLWQRNSICSVCR